MSELVRRIEETMQAHFIGYNSRGKEVFSVAYPELPMSHFGTAYRRLALAHPTAICIKLDTALGDLEYLASLDEDEQYICAVAAVRKMQKTSIYRLRGQLNTDLMDAERLIRALAAKGVIGGIDEDGYRTVLQQPNGATS